jgi:hypothetical protein
MFFKGTRDKRLKLGKNFMDLIGLG